MDPRYRFLARFGATILSGGIAAIPMALYHYQAELGLVPQEVWFVGYILAHRWSDALPFPSLRRMSRRTGISTQMLHRYKQSLIEKGYLATIPRHRPSGGRTSNYYDFTGLFRALEELLQRDQRDASWGPSLDDDAGDDALSDGDEGLPGAPMPTHRLDPNQPELPGEGQRAVAGAAQPASTGPVLAPLPAPARQNVPRNQIPVLQIVPEPEDAVPEQRAARETPKRASRNAPADEPAPVGAPSVDPAGDPRWTRALAELARTVSPAAFNAWIAPLEPVPGPPATPLVLRCASAFHLQQADRRYRKAIEEAVGAQIALIHDNHN